MEIEHNPNEKRPTNAVWWVLWPIIALAWVGQWYFDGFDWTQIALGAFTGMALASWAIEITGNQVPKSWTREPPGR